jgi:hypothetical protein
MSIGGNVNSYQCVQEYYRIALKLYDTDLKPYLCYFDASYYQKYFVSLYDRKKRVAYYPGDAQ